LKIGELGSGQSIKEELFDAVAAKEGTKVPGEGEQVTPENIVYELGEDSVNVIRLDVVGESLKPGLGYKCRIDFGEGRESQPL
jgi:hypothetical protein